MLLRDSLPIDSILAELDAALRHGHAVLQAPTGSGKSTRVPLALLDSDWLAGQQIVMLQPRRAAARLTAARLAAQLGEPLGEQVGYQIRFERRVSARTRIEVVTEGILTRRIQHDPLLSGIGLVIFDEFHERSLVADLGLALVLDSARSVRPDLRILVMSATLEAAPVAQLLGDAPILRAEGRSFPVEIRYAERPPDSDPVRAVVAAVRQAFAEEPGDLLAFLPGAREIDRAREQLAAQLGPDSAILPLHGSLSAAEQDRALRPAGSGQRRVILATDLAETSLTLDGIRVVLDSGLTRKPRFDPASGLTRLVTEAIPRASADQRAGRAGRVAPGVCWRLWTREHEHGRAEQRTPEIRTADLAPLVLELAVWGVKDPLALSWLDPPPAPAWTQAQELLRTLGALDARDALTARGRALAELPLHPRLGVMLLDATAAERQTAADLCALLTERDPLLAEPGQARAVDLGLRLDALHTWRTRNGQLSGVDRRRLEAIDRIARQVQQLAARATAAPPASAPDSAVPRTAGALLALAYPDRIAQRRSGADARYLLAAGMGAELPRDDALAVHAYLVVAALDARGRDGRIQAALPISLSEVRTVFSERLEQRRDVFWDAERAAVACRLSTRFAALVLDAQPVALRPEDNASAYLLTQIRADFDTALNWSAAARQLQARVALLRQQDAAGVWPDWSTDHLRETLADWLGPLIATHTRLAEVRQLDLHAVLRDRLSWAQRQQLDQLAPHCFTTPAGNLRPIDYVSGATPILAVPLQELFGLHDTPRLCHGRIPLLLHLLSPARRPIQVTQDLAGFWARGYAEVRKELRGRYPKHQWPDDPTQAQALVGGIRRRRVSDSTASTS